MLVLVAVWIVLVDLQKLVALLVALVETLVLLL